MRGSVDKNVDHIAAKGKLAYDALHGIDSKRHSPWAFNTSTRTWYPASQSRVFFSSQRTPGISGKC
eukprot:7506451-Ditylum_brightwellii.AAC.1